MIIKKSKYFNFKNKMKTILLIFVGLIAAVFGFFLLNSKSVNKNILDPIVNKFVSPSPTTMPLAELTIPYLRARKYESKLGPLEKYAEQSNYISYLTSYDSDGLKIEALLTKPSGTMPEGGWPAIIFLHGYIPPKTYVTTQKYITYVDYLARNGFVVFKIDLRGHGKSEGEASGAYYSSDYIIDTLNARAALQKTDFVNQHKIGLWGHSMAGNITLRSLAVKPEIPAISIWGGAVFTYTDMSKYGINDGSYVPQPTNPVRQSKRQRLRDLYGEFDPSIPFWQQFAATEYLKDVVGSIQLNHSIDDSVANVGYSRDLNTLLNKTSVSHELNEYTSGGHNFDGVSFTQAMEKTVSFFKLKLK